MLASVAYADGAVFSAAEDKRLRALNARDGTVLWTADPIPNWHSFRFYWPVIPGEYVLVRPKIQPVYASTVGGGHQRGGIELPAVELSDGSAPVVCDLPVRVLRREGQGLGGCPGLPPGRAEALQPVPNRPALAALTPPVRHRGSRIGDPGGSGAIPSLWVNRVSIEFWPTTGALAIRAAPGHSPHCVSRSSPWG
jgi:hypothetical protein